MAGKNWIDVADALYRLREEYSLTANDRLNWYQIRIGFEGCPIFYDWYWTTGALVRNRNGYCKSMGTFLSVEAVGCFVGNDLYALANE